VVRDEQLVLGGTAWQRCRNGQADPDDFRGGGRKGWRVLGMAALQDLDGLNKAELLSNDSGLYPDEDEGDVTDEDVALVDRVAEATADPDARFDAVRALYATTSYGRWVGEKLAALGQAARRERENLMPYLMDCARAYCTLGEMTDVLRETWGVYTELLAV
jgi:hypothetical protein